MSGLGYAKRDAFMDCVAARESVTSAPDSPRILRHPLCPPALRPSTSLRPGRRSSGATQHARGYSRDSRIEKKAVREHYLEVENMAPPGPAATAQTRRSDGNGEAADLEVGS